MKKQSLQQQTERFVKETKQLMAQGFEPIVKDISLPDESYLSQLEKMHRDNPLITDSKNGKVKSKLSANASLHGGLAGIDVTMLDYSQNVGLPVKGQDGKELGKFIPWGRWNNLPNMIYRMSGDMPWTAQALQYQSDTATGLGPRLMYHLARYSGGTVTDELIPYEDAGLWLRQRKRELLKTVIALQTEEEPSSAADGAGASSSPLNVVRFKTSEPQKEKSYRQQLIESYEQELKELEEDYSEWEKSLPEIDRFLQDNNLDQHFQSCMSEDVRLDIYFPTVGLNQGTSGEWNPKIVRVDLLPCSCTRFEERDEEWNLKHVFYSENWREDFITTRRQSTYEINNEEVVPYPVVLPEHGFETIREYANSNRRTSVKQRQLWWCCPQYHATPNKAYYPQPAWWSIFPSQVFRYASTLIYDKAVAKKNSVMWGKILYVNTSFLNKLFQQMGIDGDQEEQKKYRNNLYDRVEEFLKRRSNNGKLLIMDSYTSADEKQLIDSVRIVDVPQASEKDSDASLQIATSAVFFALGVHPALVGATPGSTSTSGTFQRELHLLKVTQLSPRQRRYLAWLNGIVRFNGWPRHATFVIKQATLSTLDASKTGIVETHEE